MYHCLALAGGAGEQERAADRGGQPAAAGEREHEGAGEAEALGEAGGAARGLVPVRLGQLAEAALHDGGGGQLGGGAADGEAAGGAGVPGWGEQARGCTRGRGGAAGEHERQLAARLVPDRHGGVREQHGRVGGKARAGGGGDALSGAGQPGRDAEPVGDGRPAVSSAGPAASEAAPVVSAARASRWLPARRAANASGADAPAIPPRKKYQGISRVQTGSFRIGRP